MPVDARSDMLAGIRSAIGVEGASRDEADAAWAAIPRGYRRGSEAEVEELKDLLIGRLHDYDAQVLESSREEVPASIARMLRARGVSRILIPSGLSDGILPSGFDFVPEAELSAAAMNLCEGILTESTLAIAETGTIVLQNAPGQGSRAASLVPDYHLCLVDVASIVATVPEAITRLRASATLPTTFISGPSATADIEMTRIKGVHGPRFLDVILVSDPIIGFAGDGAVIS